MIKYGFTLISVKIWDLNTKKVGVVKAFCRFLKIHVFYRCKKLVL